MAVERTLSILKPDATRRNLTGAINAMIEAAGLRIVAQKRLRMNREKAESFYAVHRARPFFSELVETMTSVAHKLGIGAPETVGKWVRRAEVEHGTPIAPCIRSSSCPGIQIHLAKQAGSAAAVDARAGRFA